MAINLDATQGAPAATGARLDRHDPDARQDRWMLELERAMFSASAKKPRGVHDGQTVAAQQEGTRGADDQQAGAEVPGKRPGVQTARDTTAGRDAHAKDGAGQGAVVAVVPAFAHAPAGLQTAASFVAAGGTAAVAPAAQTAASAAAGVAGAAGSDPLGLVQTVQAARQIAVPTAAFPPFAAPAPGGSMPAEVGPENAARPESGAAGSADAVEFDKRVMHLFAGADGLHAYIRDAELGAAQMRSVAAALNTELARGGQALATLTVNGKRIGLTNRDVPGGVFAADGPASVAGDALAEARPYSQSLTHVRKDASK